MKARVAHRVIAGGLWLDMVRPGWRDAIRWGDVNLCNTTLCVAGQVFREDALEYAETDDGNSWYTGYDMLRVRYGMGPAERARLGFTTDDMDDLSEEDPWGTLEHAWRVLWAQHADYPHEPGTLYDCGACGL